MKNLNEMKTMKQLAWESMDDTDKELERRGVDIVIRLEKILGISDRYKKYLVGAEQQKTIIKE